jgi:hypothetical protein
LARLRHGRVIGYSADTQGGASKQNHQDCDDWYSIRFHRNLQIAAKVGPVD